MFTYVEVAHVSYVCLLPPFLLSGPHLSSSVKLGWAKVHSLVRGPLLLGAQESLGLV